MQRLFILIAFLVVYSAPAVAEERTVTISYGDAYLEAKPAEIIVNRDDDIVFVLDPRPGVYKYLHVEIVGRKNVDKWLDKKGRFEDSGGKFKVKVKKDQPAGSYKYIVIVEGIGELDPRVDVLD